MIERDRFYRYNTDYQRVEYWDKHREAWAASVYSSLVFCGESSLVLYKDSWAEPYIDMGENILNASPVIRSP